MKCKCWYKGRCDYSYILDIYMVNRKKRMYFASYEELIEYVRDNDNLEPQNFIV